MQRLKKAILCSCVSFLCIWAISCSSDSQPQSLTEEQVPTFELYKGVNLSHWLSQCFGWSPRETFITEADIRFVDSIGMDHVRLPLDEKEMWNEDGTKNEESFKYMHQCIGWAKKYDLKVLVDLHIIEAHHFNSQNGEGKNVLFTDSLAQERFVNLWYQLSAELKQYPTDFLAYEFLNEPVAEDHEDWNKLVRKCYDAIRPLEPNRFIMIGSNEWQTPATFPYLKVPENDKRIILAFHFYEPLFITHYTAYWTSFKDYDGPVYYPGVTIPDSLVEAFADTTNELLMKRLNDSNKYFDKKTLAEALKPVFDKAKELGLPVVCTEFGAYNQVDTELRKTYYKDIIAIFKEHNVSWSIWDLKGDFGILQYDRENDRVTGIDTAIVNTIMQ